jgi:hypothetical protein
MFLFVFPKVKKYFQFTKQFKKNAISILKPHLKHNYILIKMANLKAQPLQLVSFQRQASKY